MANIKGSNFDVQARLTELGESFNPNTKRFNSALQEDTSLTTDLDKAFNSNFNKYKENILGDVGEEQIRLDKKVIRNISKHITVK